MCINQHNRTISTNTQLIKKSKAMQGTPKMQIQGSYSPFMSSLHFCCSLFYYKFKISSIFLNFYLFQLKQPQNYPPLQLLIFRYTASDEAGHWVAVAGRTGLAYYNVQSHKWTLFGNQTQEKDFIVTGGMLWWRHLLVIGCFNISANRYRPKKVCFI